MSKRRLFMRMYDIRYVSNLRENSIDIALMLTAGTLIAGYDGSTNQDMRMRGGLIVQKHPRLRVRRLTPMECERLQGFPTGHTDIPWHNASLRHRYKAIGKSCQFLS
ncbi:hypothetical protein DNV77_21825 [Salmonella enterica subsp. enterica]|nr:hypothetical protein [Salmonella enterica subsp. enterica]